ASFHGARRCGPPDHGGRPAALSRRRVARRAAPRGERGLTGAHVAPVAASRVTMGLRGSPRRSPMTSAPDIKPRSRTVTDGLEATASRGMLRAVGLGDEDFAK